MSIKAIEVVNLILQKVCIVLKNVIVGIDVEHHNIVSEVVNDLVKHVLNKHVEVKDHRTAIFRAVRVGFFVENFRQDNESNSSVERCIRELVKVNFKGMSSRRAVLNSIRNCIKVVVVRNEIV